MPTVQAYSVSTRLEVGDALLSAGKTVDIKPIQKRWLEFSRAHREFATAQKAVQALEEKIAKIVAHVGELDVEHDAVVEGLASALSGAGESRTNPFKSFGFESPSTIREMGDVSEAKLVIKLVAAVKKRKALPAAVNTAALRCAKAAEAIVAAAKPLEALEKAARDARAQRTPLEQKWANKFAAIKRAARSAEDDGARGLYDTLFVRIERRPASKKSKKAPATPPADPR